MPGQHLKSVYKRVQNDEKWPFSSSSKRKKPFLVSMFLAFLKIENKKLSALKKLTIHIFPTVAFWNVKGIVVLEQWTVNKWVVIALDLSLERFSSICQL